MVELDRVIHPTSNRYQLRHPGGGAVQAELFCRVQVSQTRNFGNLADGGPKADATQVVTEGIPITTSKNTNFLTVKVNRF